jgi:hypothetical protein
MSDMILSFAAGVLMAAAFMEPGKSWVPTIRAVCAWTAVLMLIRVNT